ncbi:stearoyl CoA 9-desaturase, partial [mine drainage metagenome]
RIERVATRVPVENPGQTLVGHKVHLLSIYLREVMRPTWRMVRSNGFRPTRRDRHLFWLAPKLLDGSDADRADLDHLLESEPVLRTVYEFRERLHRIWENGAQAADRLEGLREWLRQARASGVHPLEYFSEKLHQLIDNPALLAESLPTGS